jgi:glyoxylate/hydroxypyruvate reductase A
MHVLRFHRDMPAYQAAQANREWRRVTIARPEQRRIGFLGFGMMARAPALVLKSLGFPVSAWVRSPRQAAEVPIFHGRDQLEPFLSETDIAVCLLPLTRETEGIFCARTFAMMPRGAMLVNVGRGKHVVDKDLIAALDSGQLSYAALDALWPEPLPPESPLGCIPKLRSCRTWHGARPSPNSQPKWSPTSKVSDPADASCKKSTLQWDTEPPVA